MTQYFYIDESGGPALRTDQGSPYFILAMVQLPNREAISPLVKLRQELHVVPTFEFHFHQMNAKQKERFFQSIQELSFRVRTAVLLKTKFPSDLQALTGMMLTIELITRLTLRASPLDIGNDILILDGASDLMRKELRIHLSRQCQQLNRERPFKKIVSDDSAHTDGLQLADMIAGAIRQYAWGNFPVYYELISDRIVDYWLVK